MLSGCGGPAQAKFTASWPCLPTSISTGHAPGLSGKALAAYAAAGIETEHECTSFAEAKEKLAAGLAILVREGSAAKNLTAIVEGLLKEGLPTDRFLFCTDDKHLDDIAREGHIRWNVHQAVQLGMPVVGRHLTWQAIMPRGCMA